MKLVKQHGFRTKKTIKKNTNNKGYIIVYRSGCKGSGISLDGKGKTNTIRNKFSKKESKWARKSVESIS